MDFCRDRSQRHPFPSEPHQWKSRGSNCIGPPLRDSGFDIRNPAAAGDNAFVSNGCLTSINAPCPSVGPSFTADPNDTVTRNANVGQTTLSWSAPDAQLIEIHSPNGPLFTFQGNRGTAQTALGIGRNDILLTRRHWRKVLTSDTPPPRWWFICKTARPSRGFLF
jgi:hypothetical protein